MRHAWSNARPRSAAGRSAGHRTRRRLLAAVALVALTVPAREAAAQDTTGVVAGTVVTERARAPLPDVQVGVEGTQLGAVTDGQGRFRITGVTGTTARLNFRRVGYRPLDQTVTVGATDVRVAMAERAVELSEVVVTGTAGQTERRAVGNAVSQIRASDIVETQPINNIQDLINGRAAGVAIVPASGQVGTGARIRVRGASSLSLANEPLIYVDGVRVDNTQGSGPLNQGFGSRPISRWNDFNPEDIESIEIIKGPAAATLYGTEAANGVIQIITKKGAAGAPRWELSYRTGAQWFNDPEGRLYTNYWRNPETGQIETLDIVERELAAGRDIWRTGWTNEGNLSVGGGSPQLRYYVGVGAEQATGADYSNKLRRFNGRANLSLTPSEKWDLTASLGYTNGRTYLPLEAGGGGPTWTTYWATPENLGDDPRRGFYSGPPEAYRAAYEIFQDVARFTGSLAFNHRPTSWFNHRLIVGTDALNEDNQEIAQQNTDLAVFFSELAGETNGYMEVSTRRVTYNTADYVANATYPLGSAWELTSSLGAQYYSRNTQLRQMYGEGFPAPGLKSLSALSLIEQDDDDLIENTTVGVFFQQQFAWRDRVFVTGAVRADDNSNFGENFDLVYYPKASVSWVISDEPFFRVPAVSTLKLRAAYGQSGQQPAALTALRTYIPGGSGTVTPGAVGNPDLGPERSEELEVGADLSMFEDRLGLELTYFTGRTTDAILTRDVAPSTGFGGVPDPVQGLGLQYFNAGEVSRSGFEMTLRGTPVERERVRWDFSFSLGTNENEIEDLGSTDFISLGATEAHVVGYPVGSWFSRDVVSAELNAEGEAVNLQCADGRGGTVACANAPRVYLGNTVPKTEGAFTTSLTLFRDLRIGAMVDFKTGYKKLDGNRRVRCNLFTMCRENFFPEEFDPAVIASVQGGTAFIDDLVRDASYAKLRELSATYTIPPRYLAMAGVERASVTLAGRNLHTWTDYTGLEPEASFASGSRGAFGQWEQNVLPQLRQWVLTFNVGF